MRLLTYGGSGFRERRRIGVWRDPPIGAFEDSYGLPPGALTFGLCILDDDPILLIRQRQQVENRGGYPYTMLLAAGEEVWNRFGWNAALLTLAVMKSHHASNALLYEPEQLTTDSLSGLVEELGLPEIGVPDPEYRQVAASIAASASFSNIVRVDLSSFRLTSRPSPEDLAPALAEMPACFRSARGWLIGSSIKNAETFGASFVLDDVTTLQERVAAELSAKGQKLINDWRQVEGCIAARPEIEKRQMVPFWRPEWKDRTEFFAQAAILAELLRGNVVKDFYQTITGQTYDEPLGRCIEEEAFALALRPDDAQFSPECTRFVLNYCSGGKHSLKPDVVDRLDPLTLRKNLALHGAPPCDAPSWLELSDELRFELSRELLQSTQVDLPTELDQALGFCKKMRPEWRQALVTLVKESVHNKKLALEMWHGRTQIAEFDFTDFLRDEARARGAQSRAAVAYVLFANDPGGELIADKLDSTSADRFVRELLNAVSGSYAEPVAKWLDSLARSGLRQKISVHTKIGIAKLVSAKGKDDWRPLLDLEAALYGKKPLPADLPNEELPVLRDELLQVLSSTGLDNVPLLDSIAAALKPLPPLLLSRLAEINVEPSSRHAALSWIKGLRLLELDDAADKAACHWLNVALDAMEASGSVNSFEIDFDDLGACAVRRCLETILYGGDARDDAKHRRALQAVIMRWKGPVDRCLESLMEDGLNTGKEETIRRRFGTTQSQVLKELTLCLSEQCQLKLLDCIASDDDFRSFAQPILEKFWMGDTHAFTPFEKVMLAFLKQKASILSHHAILLLGRPDAAALIATITRFSPDQRAGE